MRANAIFKLVWLFFLAIACQAQRKQPLTAIVEVEGKPYDGTTDVTVHVSLEGVTEGDDVSVIVVSAHFLSPEVGNQTVVVTLELEGRDKDKYQLTNPEVILTATIRPATTISPTTAPSTRLPSLSPSRSPSRDPTPAPSLIPTALPLDNPTPSPSQVRAKPTDTPTTDAPSGSQTSAARSTTLTAKGSVSAASDGDVWNLPVIIASSTIAFVLICCVCCCHRKQLKDLKRRWSNALFALRLRQPASLVAKARPYSKPAQEPEIAIEGPVAELQFVAVAAPQDEEDEKADVFETSQGGGEEEVAEKPPAIQVEESISAAPPVVVQRDEFSSSFLDWRNTIGTPPAQIAEEEVDPDEKVDLRANLFTSKISGGSSEQEEKTPPPR
ncbi:YDG domain-containing protein [Nitratireductor sp. XY-223]|uniref:YDG domain-containing protein n=1 Tax=Nitratireductor sp. XY-223 TaxID=2561926 RepID=UPI0010A9A29B|nr:YDG domain-containing protein [Nitratireductor sp. XY-223]